MREAAVFAAVVVALVVGAGAACGDSITPTGIRSQSIAYDGTTFDHPDDYYPSSVPSPLTTVASQQGNEAWTSTTTTSSSIASSGVWETGGGTLDSWSQSVVNVYFTAEGAFDFEITGAYEFEGGTGSAYFEVYLYDLTAGYLFQNNQESSAVDGESFAVGETGGATFNYLVGSLTGTLIEDHDYLFTFQAFVRDDGNADPLNGSGWARFDIVPEPTTLALLGLGLAAFAWRRRRA